jgi:hypothetical protein
LGLTANPVSFQVDHDSRTVYTTAHGVLQVDDFVAHAHDLANAGLFAYSQLIDAGEARLKISPSDVETLVSLNKELRRFHGNARTAFVTKETADFGMMRMYEILIGEDDPGFAVFYDIYHAEQWVLS